MITKSLIIILLCFISIHGSAQLKTYPDTVETFVIPEKSAEFPGGVSKLSRYIVDNFSSKVEIQKDEVSIFRSPVVQWTVDETGKVVEVRIFRSTNIAKADRLLIEAIENMPLWKPAEHGGKKVRQEFKFPITVCFK